MRVSGKYTTRTDLMLVLLITISGGVMRFTMLSETPPGFFCDEASTGYDAYSILQTGRDQHGEKLPLYARSFDDKICMPLLHIAFTA